MASLASERSWLFTPTTMKRVQQCRRLIQLEFGVKLHLTEELLVEQLNTYVGRSRSDSLRRTWSELRNAVPELADAIAEIENTSKQTYRGQTVPDARDNDADPEASRPRKAKVIYRGQVVG